MRLYFCKRGDVSEVLYGIILRGQGGKRKFVYLPKAKPKPLEIEMYSLN